MEENLKKVFRERLMQAMEGASMTQAELARQTGCGKELIHYYTHGRQVPNFYNAYAIAKALGVDLYWLMGVDEDGQSGTPAPTEKASEDEPPKSGKDAAAAERRRKERKEREW